MLKFICKQLKRLKMYFTEENVMKMIYALIKKIVLDNEPNAGDEFAWLDMIFENLPF